MKKRNVICIIMGGGRGSRLNPLTKERCKPAVPLAGKYRLVDIPISNCLNSGLNQIFILSQFNTASLHRHIQESYKFDPFGGGFVDILSAEQTDTSSHWYQGTADAVRQNMHHFHGGEDDLYVILSGDQLYRMDLQDLIREHDASGASVTVTAKPLPATEAEGLGLMRVDDTLTIQEFVEKPTDPDVIAGLIGGTKCIEAYAVSKGSALLFGFNGHLCVQCVRSVDALKTDATDFGKEIIPSLLGNAHLHAYVFDDYWEDIGTVRAFFDANLRLTDPVPPFNFFDEAARIYTRARYLPAAKINAGSMTRSIVSDGCILTQAKLTRVLLGVRSVVRPATHLDNVVMMGADCFEGENEFEENRQLDRPDLGVGQYCHIKNAILDKNVRIGNHVTLDPTGLPDHFGPGVDIAIRDGVLVVCKDTVIPDGFTLKA